MICWCALVPSRRTRVHSLSRRSGMQQSHHRYLSWTAIAAVQLCRVQYERRRFNCNGTNHLAKDCLLQRNGTDKRTDVSASGVAVRTSAASARKTSRESSQRQPFIRLSKNRGAQPCTEVLIDGTRVFALVDSGCSLCICHESVCWQWQKRNVYLKATNAIDRLIHSYFIYKKNIFTVVHFFGLVQKRQALISRHLSQFPTR